MAKRVLRPSLFVAQYAASCISIALCVSPVAMGVVEARMWRRINPHPKLPGEGQPEAFAVPPQLPE